MNANITSFNEFERFTNITSLESEAFARCELMTSIKLPPSCKTFYDNSTFYGSGITSMELNAPLRLANRMFINCTKLTYMKLTNFTLTSIPYGFLEGCLSLKSFTIPPSVTILNRTFRQTSLLHIEIPSSVTIMQEETFCGNDSCIDIRIYADTPATIDNNVFDATNDAPIYVPDASLSTYKNATNWSKYSNRIKAISTFTE